MLFVPFQLVEDVSCSSAFLSGAFNWIDKNEWKQVKPLG